MSYILPYNTKTKIERTFKSSTNEIINTNSKSGLFEWFNEIITLEDPDFDKLTPNEDELNDYKTKLAPCYRIGHYIHKIGTNKSHPIQYSKFNIVTEWDLMELDYIYPVVFDADNLDQLIEVVKFLKFLGVEVNITQKSISYGKFGKYGYHYYVFFKAHRYDHTIDRNINNKIANAKYVKLIDTLKSLIRSGKYKFDISTISETQYICQSPHKPEIKSMEIPDMDFVLQIDDQVYYNYLEFLRKGEIKHELFSFKNRSAIYDKNRFNSKKYDVISNIEIDENIVMEFFNSKIEELSKNTLNSSEVDKLVRYTDPFVVLKLIIEKIPDNGFLKYNTADKNSIAIKISNNEKSPFDGYVYYNNKKCIMFNSVLAIKHLKLDELGIDYKYAENGRQIYINSNHIYTILKQIRKNLGINIPELDQLLEGTSSFTPVYFEKVNNVSLPIIEDVVTELIDKLNSGERLIAPNKDFSHKIVSNQRNLYNSLSIILAKYEVTEESMHISGTKGKSAKVWDFRKIKKVKLRNLIKELSSTFLNVVEQFESYILKFIKTCNKTMRNINWLANRYKDDMKITNGDWKLRRELTTKFLNNVNNEMSKLYDTYKQMKNNINYTIKQSREYNIFKDQLYDIYNWYLYKLRYRLYRLIKYVGMGKLYYSDYNYTYTSDFVLTNEYIAALLGDGPLPPKSNKDPLNLYRRSNYNWDIEIVFINYKRELRSKYKKWVA